MTAFHGNIIEKIGTDLRLRRHLARLSQKHEMRATRFLLSSPVVCWWSFDIAREEVLFKYNDSLLCGCAMRPTPTINEDCERANLVSAILSHFLDNTKHCESRPHYTRRETSTEAVNLFLPVRPRMTSSWLISYTIAEDPVMPSRLPLSRVVNAWEVRCSDNLNRIHSFVRRCIHGQGSMAMYASVIGFPRL